MGHLLKINYYYYYIYLFLQTLLSYKCTYLYYSKWLFQLEDSFEYPHQMYIISSKELWEHELACVNGVLCHFQEFSINYGSISWYVPIITDPYMLTSVSQL